MSSIRRMFLHVVLVPCVLAQGCALGPPGSDELRDPVCGRPVSPDRAIHRHYDRWEYSFDSEDCARKFDEHPARYIDMYYYVLENQDGS